MLIQIVVLLAAAAQTSGDPAALWKKADALLEQHQYAEARRVLTLAVKAAPNEPALWFHLGVSCAELKDVDGAIRAFEKARALSPKRAEVYFSLGLEYWHRGDVGKAKEAYRAGLALNPAEPRGLQNYALLLMKTGEPARAVEPLLTLKGVPGLTLPARVSLIGCYLRTGDREKAERETDELLRADIAGPEEETKLGAILIQDGYPDVAERVLRNSLSREPDQAKACAALGVILLNKKRYPEAANSLERAVRLAPDSSEYALAYAEALLALDHETELLRFLQKVEPKFGNLPEFQYKLALAYYAETKFTDTIATLKKLQGMNPRRQDPIYYMLGNAYLVVGNFGEAEKAYRKAIEINPKDPAYYEEFATLLRREGHDRVEEAITQLTRAHQFDPANAHLALQLALCYESKGELMQAVGLAEEAIRKEPELLPGHVALARIYFRLGRKAEGTKEKRTISGLEQKAQQERINPKLAAKGIVDSNIQ